MNGKGLFAAGLLVASSCANADIISCNACTEAGYESRARQAGRGQHLVYDLFSNKVVAFGVDIDWESRRVRVRPEQVDPKYAEVVAALSAYYHDTRGLMAKVVHVDAGHLQLDGLNEAGAFDIVGDGNLRRRLGSRLAAGLPASGAEAWNNAQQVLAERALQYMGFVDGSSIQVVVHLDDGSSVVYALDAAAYAGEYSEGTARMADGQTIPDANDPSWAGNWTVPDRSTLSRWLKNMRRLGVSISSSGDGDSIRWSCQWSGTSLACKPD